MAKCPQLQFYSVFITKFRRFMYLHQSVPGSWLIILEKVSGQYQEIPKKHLGLNRDLNPGPPAPEAGIIPLDH